MSTYIKCHKDEPYDKWLCRDNIDCTKKILFYDFRERGWVPEDFPVVFGEDGEVIAGPEGITVDSVPFTSTIPIGNEHVKWLRYFGQRITLPLDCETIYEAKIAVSQFIPVNQIPAKFFGRFRNIQEDIRFCSAAINVLQDMGDARGFVSDVFMSNEKIYALDERLNIFWQTPQEYAAYTNCAVIGTRQADAVNDFVKVGIGIHPGKGYVRWYVNGQVRFERIRPGTRQQDQFRVQEHGGPATAITPTEILIGFGTFSLLDFALPYNYARQYTNEVGNQAVSALVQLEPTGNYGELYPGQLEGDGRPLLSPTQTFGYVLGETPDDNLNVKLFGQGAILRLKYLKVFQVCIKPKECQVFNDRKDCLRKMSSEEIKLLEEKCKNKKCSHRRRRH